MTDNTVAEEKLTENLLMLESDDLQAVEDRAAFLTEIGWKESSRTFNAGKVRAMLEKAA
jgi:hypothetical protein